MKPRLILLIVGMLLSGACAHAANDASSAGELDKTALNRFMESLVQSHDLDKSELEQTFGQAQYLQSVIDAITRPAEKMPWHRYKKIFLTEDRIQGGVQYWREHRETLARAEAEYGVPAEIIVAIIGVETRYGAHKGRYRVIDSLATLAFHYPKRADFFRSELEHFILLAREESVDPLSISGSYAGAMGIPQFISSSYRAYAVDFNGDEQANLWDDHADAIGSVANYFARHGWATGEPVIFQVQDMPAVLKEQADTNPKPGIDYARLQQAGVSLNPASLPPDTPVALLEFEENDGSAYWAGLNNFYVITRYNHSPLYALAVYLLSQEIRASYEAGN